MLYLHHGHLDHGRVCVALSRLHLRRGHCVLQLLLHVPTRLQAKVLHDVRVENAHRGGRCGDQRRLHESQVHVDVQIVHLFRESLRQFAHQDAGVLSDRIHWLRLRHRGQQFLDVLDLKRLIHPAIGRMQVMKLRGRLRHLQLGLGQSNPLGHREDVRVADRNDVHAVVKVGGEHRPLCSGNLVGVFLRQVVGKDAGQNAELKALCVVQALVDCRHDLHAALEQGDGRADRSLLVHAAGLLVRQ